MTQTPDSRDVERTITRVRWAAVRANSESWSPPPGPTLVIAARPVDCILGAGGLIAHQCGRGIPVTIVALADTGPTRPELAAIHKLGVDVDAVLHLALPSGSFEHHEEGIAEVIRHHAGSHDLVAAPWHREPDPDRAVAGRAAAAVAAVSDVDLVRTITEGWQRSDPDEADGLELARVELTTAAWARRKGAMATLGIAGEEEAFGSPDLEPLEWTEEYVLR